jgi:hypothetical protein
MLAPRWTTIAHLGALSPSDTVSKTDYMK